MNDTTAPIPGLSLGFWGIACLIFGGIGFAGLGRDSTLYGLGLIGCGAMMVIAGLFQRFTTDRLR